MQEGNEEPFNIRLHLAKDILTIQEQDVICVSGEPFYSSVSSCVPRPGSLSGRSSVTTLSPPSEFPVSPRNQPQT